MKRFTVIFLISWVVFYLVAFASWSALPGNAAPGGSSEAAAIPWKIFSFPAFYFATQETLLRDFQALLLVNAFLWAIFFSLIFKMVGPAKA